MLGLFGTLSLGTRSLQTQRAGVEVAGQNLANVNNPAYARQRVSIQTSIAVAGPMGLQGTGADAVAIQQIRDSLLDQQITNETSVGGYLDAQQTALQYAQANLGEIVDRNASGASGASATSANNTHTGLADDLNNLFAAFQSISTAPTSLTERQLLVARAQDLATKFNQTSTRLSDLRDSMNTSLGNDVTGANQLLKDIASLNDQIINAENAEGGVANDLRDMRQSKLEELAKLVKVDATLTNNGALNISVNGNALVTDRDVNDTFQTVDVGAGQMMVQLATGGTALALTGGHMQGLIDVRDGALTTLTNKLDVLAGTLITEVNAAHTGGFGLGGTTGAAFFNGTDAKTISVNAALVGDPSLVQISGVSGNTGDNKIALALAQVGDKKIAALGGQTLSQQYSVTVAEVGQSLASVNGRISDQSAVAKMLNTQRSSVSGVSVDEEMTDIMKYQKAFEASAKLISTIDEMLDVLVNLKR